MPQRQSRRAYRPERSHASSVQSAGAPLPTAADALWSAADRQTDAISPPVADPAPPSPESEWANSRPKHSARTSNLPRLIDMNAPLSSHSTLVLMYGPFQAEMKSEAGQGVATWIKDCLTKHGLPSLVRFDHRHRAQIYRRDEFQSWLEPLMKA
jgi:hypothetical protein